MDEQERRVWSFRPEASQQQVPPDPTEDAVSTMMEMAGEDLDALMQVLQVWKDTRAEMYEERGDDIRAGHVTGMYMAVGLNGIGNLFGAIPPEAPAYDAHLAGEGVRRGWRR